MAESEKMRMPLIDFFSVFYSFERVINSKDTAMYPPFEPKSKQMNHRIPFKWQK